ncbi:hypothetical protein HI914_03157 [Erysiphe necator]|nr:hypothetical protein HI914_03157 [Erysiphe necator]
MNRTIKFMRNEVRNQLQIKVDWNIDLDGDWPCTYTLVSPVHLMPVSESPPELNRQLQADLGNGKLTHLQSTASD